jgi:hypothetical protein
MPCRPVAEYAMGVICGYIAPRAAAILTREIFTGFAGRPRLIKSAKKTAGFYFSREIEERVRLATLDAGTCIVIVLCMACL